MLQLQPTPTLPFSFFLVFLVRVLWIMEYSLLLKEVAFAIVL